MASLRSFAVVPVLGVEARVALLDLLELLLRERDLLRAIAQQQQTAHHGAEHQRQQQPYVPGHGRIPPVIVLLNHTPPSSLCQCAPVAGYNARRFPLPTSPAMACQSPLIVALDFPSREAALALAARL